MTLTMTMAAERGSNFNVWHGSLMTGLEDNDEGHGHQKPDDCTLACLT